MSTSAAQVSSSDPVPLRPHPERGAPVNLPRPLTSFIGREQEVAAIAASLAREEVRLLTLTGPGGVGKTRLAIRAIKQAPEFPDGVWFVPLAAIRDPALVLPTIATALGLRQNAVQSVDEDLIAFMRGRRALLVLDNLEQVVGAGTALTGLLAACPDLNLLVTSRVPLRVSGEYRYAVPPMSAPDADGRWPLDRLAASDAVLLFVARAEANFAGFALTPENAADVAAICRQVDGLPLAIELAAARIGTFPVHILRDLLRHRLEVLKSGPRDVPDRLRTMRGAIAWSHDLLDEDEQAMFRRLAVFAGGFTLDAAAEVLGPLSDLLDGVTSLVDKQMLVPMNAADNESRFTMLETIREYGLERLAASGEEPEVRARHAACFLAQATAAEFCFFTPLEEALPIIDRLEADHANLRAARDWFVRTGDTESELRLAGALGALWAILGHSREGRVWLEQALAHDPPSETLARARALTTLSWVTRRLGDIPAAAANAANGLVLSRALGDAPGTVHSLLLSGVAACHAGDFDRETVLAQEALQLLDSLGESAPWAPFAASVALEQLAENALRRGDIEEAASLCQAALDRQRALGYRPGTSHLYASHPVTTLGDLARARYDHVVALQQYQTGLELAWRHRDAGGIARGLGNIAATLAVTGQYSLAARLFGASEAFHEVIGRQFAAEIFDRQRALGLPEPWLAADQPFGTYQQLRAMMQAKEAVPYPPIPQPAMAQTWWAEGRTIPVDEAVALALDAGQPTARDPAPFRGLSPRELEILRFLVTGQSNRAIAGALYLSERTVENHVRHILTKLDIDSRTAAATYAVRQGLV